MCSKRYLAEDEPPTKKLVSEGDLLIKQLAKKQQNKEITLKLELSKIQQFERASEILPLSQDLAGECSNKKFVEISKKNSDLVELRFAGLNNNDIQLYSDFKQGFDYFISKHKTSEKSILIERIDLINAKISEYHQTKPNLTEQSAVCSRNESETLNVKPDSVETQLLKFALSNKEKTPNKIPHPLDCVKKINDELFGHLTDNISVNKVRRKARKLANRISGHSNISNTVKAELNGSKWDQLHTELIKPPEAIPERKNYTCNALNYYTVKNREIVKLTNNGTAIKVNGDKMNYEEIIKIPKFQKYKLGDLSKMLYLKNLPAKITEDDLRKIFNKFNTNNDLVFKVMTGRMKGQAFITFSDENSANDALKELNGLLLDDKPMLMAFGKGK